MCAGHTTKSFKEESSMAMERENRAPRGNGRKRKKVCQFCVDKVEWIDYKDAAKLRRFISERVSSSTVGISSMPLQTASIYIIEPPESRA